LGALVFCGWLIAPHGRALAQDRLGTDRLDPAFAQARALWLADDEAAALPALADLARAGNTAARMLLGLIDKTPALQGPWLTRLPRADRVTLLRATGGLSGQNWITVDAEQTQQARLWYDLWHGKDDLEIAQAFATLGEPRAVVQALLAVASRQQRPFAPEVLAQDWFPDGLVHLGTGWGQDAGLVDRLPAGDPQRDMLGLVVAEEDRLQWLATAPEAAPLRALCNTRCPETAQACTLALLWGFPAPQSLMVHGSPSEQVIDTDSFVRSAKGQASLARRIMLLRAARMRQPHATKLAERNACAADWLRAEYARFDPSVPQAPKTPE
jgi:hypothetical protein